MLHKMLLDAHKMSSHLSYYQLLWNNAIFGATGPLLDHSMISGIEV